MNVLCLQSVEGKNSLQVIKKLNKEKDFLKQPAEEVEEKEKIVLHGQKITMQRRYTRQLLKIGKGWPFITVWMEEGVAVAEGSLLKQCDLYISYPNKAINNVKKLLTYIMKSGTFVLVEPNVNERMKQLQGSFDPRTLASYKKKNIRAGLLSHIPWQVYVVNSAWDKYLSNPLDRAALRQLRVKIRRLRSMISFFKPVLVPEQCLIWQSFFKNQGEDLSSLRELDVILMSLNRIQEGIGKNKGKTHGLQVEFEKRRDEAIKRIQGNRKLEAITGRLADFLLFLQGRAVIQPYSDMPLKKFFKIRLKEWSDNIMGLTERYQDFSNMEEAHKIRIKVKRFRYVVMSLPEINQGTMNLLRKLKRLQDVLGFLHDDYVNGLLVQDIDVGTNDDLEYEIAVFTGWESAKVETSIGALDALWEDFCDELKAWKK